MTSKDLKERIITVDGKDTGVRENNRGDIYINHKIFFQQDRVKAILNKLREVGIPHKKVPTNV